MTKKNKRKLRRKQREILYLLLSVILFLVNCLCSFHVMASITEVFSERGLDTSNKLRFYGMFDLSNQSETEKSTELFKSFEEDANISNDYNYTENIEIIEVIEIEDKIEVEIEDDTENRIEIEIQYTGEDDNDAEWRYKLTESEVNLVAAVAMLEDVEAMEAISEVILNRLESDKFEGTTVDSIIYAKGQFYVASRIDNAIVTNEAIEATLAVFRDGISVVGDAKFFAEKSVNPEKIAKGLYLIDSIGNSNFYGQE